MVSEATRRLTEGYFEFRALGSVPMKGVSDSVGLYEATGIGRLRTPLEVSASHGLARFVGRRGELERMQRILQLAKAGRFLMQDEDQKAGALPGRGQWIATSSASSRWPGSPTRSISLTAGATTSSRAYRPAANGGRASGSGRAGSDGVETTEFSETTD